VSRENDTGEETGKGDRRKSDMVRMVGKTKKEERESVGADSTRTA
jgi:hypothetical protein